MGGGLWLTDGALWIVLAACVMACGRRGRGPARWALPLALVVLAVHLAVPTRSVLSFGASLLVVGGVYALRPFASGLPLLGALLVNPFFRYVDTVGGFELRLWLTRVVARVLRAAGREAEAAGNVIVLDGTRFAVDAECLGVYLLLTGVAAAFGLLALAEHRHAEREGRALRLWAAGGTVVAVAVPGVIAANLARIGALTLGGWGPDHALHQAVGLLSFAVYALLPLSTVAALLPRLGLAWRSGAPRSSGWSRSAPRWRTLATGVILFCGAAFAVQRAATAPPPTGIAGAQMIDGVAPETRPGGVMAYRLPDALLYVKPIPAFYHAEHSPAVCWRGSGYRFADVDRRPVGGSTGGEVYTARLRPAAGAGGETLYTAWWMSNGARRTVDQAAWRSDMAAGAAPYALVNVSAATPAELAGAVARLYPAM